MTRSRIMELAIFWGLCLILGSAWVLGLAHSAGASSLRGLAIESALAGIGCASAGHRQFAKAGRSKWFKIALWGSALALPAAVSAGARVALSDTALTLTFTLVPVSAVLVSGQQSVGFGSGHEGLRRLLPAILGAGGAALLLPFALPQGTPSQLWFAAAAASAAVTGIALVRLHALLEGVTIPAAASVVFAAWAILYGGLSFLEPRTEGIIWRDLALFGGLQICLSAALVIFSLWLLQRWTPVQASARYLAAPLVTLVEGAVLVRPAITWYLSLGLVMMACAVAVLIQPDAADFVDALAD